MHRSVRAAGWAAALALLAACTRPGGGVPLPSPSGPALTVAGFITEVEFGDMSLRTLDGRSLIFDVRDGPVPEQRLHLLLGERRAIRVTYRAGAGTLVPVHIVELCPGPQCPPFPSPYSADAPTPSP